MIFGYATRPAAALGSRFGPYLSGGLGGKPVLIKGGGYLIRVILTGEEARVIVLEAPERLGGLSPAQREIAAVEASRTVLGTYLGARTIRVEFAERLLTSGTPNRNLRIVDASRIAGALGHVRRIKT